MHAGFVAIYTQLKKKKPTIEMVFDIERTSYQQTILAKRQHTLTNEPPACRDLNCAQSTEQTKA